MVWGHGEYLLTEWVSGVECSGLQMEGEEERVGLFGLLKG